MKEFLNKYKLESLTTILAIVEAGSVKIMQIEVGLRKKALTYRNPRLAHATLALAFVKPSSHTVPQLPL